MHSDWLCPRCAGIHIEDMNHVMFESAGYLPSGNSATGCNVILGVPGTKRSCCKFMNHKDQAAVAELLFLRLIDVKCDVRHQELWCDLCANSTRMRYNNNNNNNQSL
jgi:hypothetical protein